MNSPEPTLSSRPTKVEVPKELPKVSMVNTSLKKLKYHLAGFDVVVKEKTTPAAIIEGSWGFEHTKACFRDEIIPFVKALKDLLNSFNQYLVDELFEVQNVFHQMEHALNENERLLEQVLSKDIVNIIVNSSVDNSDVNVKSVLNLRLSFKQISLKKRFMISCSKRFSDTQLNQELFQRDNSVSNQSAPSIDQYFEINEFKAQSQEKDTVIKKLKEQIKSLYGNKNENKVKKDFEEIETINIELDHRVSKLIAKNEHLKHTYKQLYDSIKPARIRSKEQCLKNELRKLKGKSVIACRESVNKPKVITPVVHKVDLEPLSPKLKNNKEAHIDYIKITKENADTLCDIVEQARTSNPLDNALAYACMYTKQIQELLVYVSDTCPSSPLKSKKLVAVTPMNKTRKVTFAKTSTTSDNKTQIQVDVHQIQTTSKPLVPSTNKKCSTNTSRSKPRSERKSNRIMQPLSSNQKSQKIEAHTRNAKPSLTKEDMNDRARAKAVKSIEKKEWKPTGKMFKNVRYKWVPTGRTFTIVGTKCTLIRFTSTKIVPPRKPVKSTVITNIKPGSASQWRPKETNHASSNSAPKIVESRTANHLEPNKHMGSNVSISPCSSSVQCRSYKSYLGLGLHQMTPGYITSGLVQNPSSSTPNVPPSKKDCDILFQPLFDEYFNLTRSVWEGSSPLALLSNPSISAIHFPIIGGAIVQTDMCILHLSYLLCFSLLHHYLLIQPLHLLQTTIDQDVPSASTSSTYQEIQSQVIHQRVEEQIHGNQNAQFDNAPLLHNLSSDPSSEETTSQGVIPSNLHHLNQSFDTLTQLTKNHPLENIFGDLSRPISTRRQLQEHAIWCYVDANDNPILFDGKRSG
ncbi:hypothetical protein Tco_0467781 [Tanacetum coccineum]